MWLHELPPKSTEWLFGLGGGDLALIFSKVPEVWGDLTRLFSCLWRGPAQGHRPLPEASGGPSTLPLCSAQSSEKHFSGLHVCRLCWWTFSDMRGRALPSEKWHYSFKRLRLSKQDPGLTLKPEKGGFPIQVLRLVGEAENSQTWWNWQHGAT